MPLMPIERSAMAGQLFPDTLAVGIPVQLLANRPDVRQAEHVLAEAFYATNTARALFIRVSTSPAVQDGRITTAV